MAAKKKEQDKSIVKWKDSAGIESSKKLQKELLDAFNTSSTVFLDLSEVEDIDLTGIQLIISAKKEADSQKKYFFIKGNIPESISEYVSGCGVSLKDFLNPEETKREKSSNSQEAENA